VAVMSSLVKRAIGSGEEDFGVFLLISLRESG
jgi:hypothetical protein